MINSRDRNREHARNTRLRKKIYVSKLKEFVENLSEQKRAEIKQCSEMGARIHEMHTTRKELVRLFLSYRANNIQVCLSDIFISDRKVSHVFCFGNTFLCLCIVHNVTGPRLVGCHSGRRTNILFYTTLSDVPSLP